LPPGNIVKPLALLNSQRVEDGVWVNPDEDRDLVPTLVTINDLALDAEHPFMIDKEGFEKASHKLNLPSPDQTVSPNTPWSTADRPLKWFIDQLDISFNAISLRNHNVFIARCNGELIRGAAASGAAKSGAARWPPTFNAHVDQDLSGSPLTNYSILLPFLFTRTPLQLLNLWFPLNSEQVRPLALRDIQTIKTGDLASWQEKTFSIPSDRFAVTNSSTTGWYYDSSMKPGDVFVFLTGSTPHTSFGRQEAGEGVRYSVEVRCAALLLPKTLTPFLYLSLTIPMILVFLLRRRYRCNRKLKKA